jgi:hypothetical protein
VREIRYATSRIARRITTPRSTQPQGDELEEELAVVVVVVGWEVVVVV